MPHLTDEEYLFIQAFVDKLLAELDQAGLELTVDSETAGWVDFMRTAPEIGHITTTFDPRHSGANYQNSFWVNLKTGSGEIVTCACHRVFQTDDFIELLRSNHLFFDKKPQLKHFLMNLSLPENCPRISGTVGHSGGFWVHPDFRGAGLGALIPRLVRTLSLRHFNLDWNTVAMRNTARRRAMARQAYGYDHDYILSIGVWPPYGEPYDMQLMYMSRAEILAQARADASATELLAAAA